jgi:hypothetical protein
MGESRFLREKNLYSRIDFGLKPVFNDVIDSFGVLVLPRLTGSSGWNFALQQNSEDFIRDVFLEKSIRSLAKFHEQFSLKDSRIICVNQNGYEFRSWVSLAHGDCHLGNLWVEENRFFWFDFEGGLLGEKWAGWEDADFWDLACLARSFHYLFCTKNPDFKGDLSVFYIQVLELYCAERKVFESEECFKSFEKSYFLSLLSRSIYECEYESLNRLDWLWIPTRGRQEVEKILCERGILF